MPSAELGRIDLGDVTPHNIKLLRKVNTVVFPVSYHDKFYKDVLEAGELAKLAYFNDIVVGAVCCRVDMQGAGRKVWILLTFLNLWQDNSFCVPAVHNDTGVPGALPSVRDWHSDA